MPEIWLLSLFEVLKQTLLNFCLLSCLQSMTLVIFLIQTSQMVVLYFNLLSLMSPIRLPINKTLLAADQFLCVHVYTVITAAIQRRTAVERQSNRGCKNGINCLWVVSMTTRKCKLVSFLFDRVHYYCATLCVSAVFAVARCPSVCPSVTIVYCIQTAEDIVRLLSRSGSHIILVFPTPSVGTHFQGKPLQLGR